MVVNPRFICLYHIASPTKDGIGESNSQKPDRPPILSKLLNNNSTSKSSSGNKENFGSRDSLNETGIISGNVAAYRKSLENKVMDISEKASNRKSLEQKNNSEHWSLDERKTTPPPVLTKKPIIPVKKSPTVGSMAGNLFSGLKQKVRSEHKSNDSLDGIGQSKPTSHIADTSEKGIVGERIKKESTEFDNVERGSSILPDMRSNRVKAPKRRLPSGAPNSVGDTISINQPYQNGGSSGSNVTSNGVGEDAKTESADDDVAKPKTKNWEKHKAPWIDELKASQAIKKTTPNVEAASRSPDTTNKADLESNEKFDMSKSFSSSYVSSHKKTSEINSFEVRSNSVDVKNSTADLVKKEKDDSMVRSMSSLGTTKLSFSEEEHSKIRPTSVNLRNRSISPIGRAAVTNNTKSMHVTGSSHAVAPSTATSISANSTSHVTSIAESVSATPYKLQATTTNDLSTVPPPAQFTTSSTTVTATASTPVTSENVCNRVMKLEQKVLVLEKLVQIQNKTIEELLKTVKDESDKVKQLKGELDKYAQCVTQV